MSDSASRRRIVAVHLLDDFSGSAKVFAHALTELASNAELRIVVGSAGASGFIRASHSVETVFYRFRENRVLLLIYFSLAQLLLFFRVTRLCLFWRADTVYVNTVLPAGAVLAGRLCRRRVVVHAHEVGLGSRLLFGVVFGVARNGASHMICVSNYVREALHLPASFATVIHNSLPEPEWRRASAIGTAREADTSRPFLSVMACSLKWYKGVDSFLTLARRAMEQSPGRTRARRFRLLLNCNADEWSEYSAGTTLSGNLEIVLRPPDVYVHYSEADLVLNLSHPEGWVETFGLTLLEAMACAVPVICPKVGGCVELFDEGRGGWRIDSRDYAAIEAVTEKLAADPAFWRAHSAHAIDNAQRFAPGNFAAALRTIVLPAH